MITTLVGENSFARNLYLTNKINQDKSKYGQYSVEVIELDNCDSLLIQEKLFSSSLFTEHVLYVFLINDLNIEIDNFLKTILNSDYLVADIILNFTVLDNKTSLARLLKSKTTVMEFKSLAKYQLKKWLIDYVHEFSGHIDSESADYLIDNFSSDQLMLSNEIKKLLLYDADIKIENIKLLSNLSFDRNIFDLIDAMFSKKPALALSIYRSLRQQNEPALKIISTISWSLANISLVKLATNKSLDELAKESGLKYQSLVSSKKMASMISFIQLKRIINNLTLIDYQSKKLFIDIDKSMEIFFLDLT